MEGQLKLTWDCLDSWQTAIEAATYLHDGFHSTTSPTPVPKMQGCRPPSPHCVDSGWALRRPVGWMCTAPDTFVPPEYEFTHICPSRVFDWKPSLAPHISEDVFAEAHEPPDQVTLDVLRWIRRTLCSIAVGECPHEVRRYAATLLNDTDDSVLIDVVQATGEEMCRRAGEQGKLIR